MKSTRCGEVPTGSFAEHNKVCTGVLPPPPPYKKVEATTTTAGEMDEEEVVLVPSGGNGPTVNVGGTQVPLSAPLAGPPPPPLALVSIDGDDSMWPRPDRTQFLKANTTAQGRYCTQHNTVGHDAATVQLLVDPKDSALRANARVFVPGGNPQGAVPRAPQTPPPVYQADSAVVLQKEVFGLPEGTLHAHALNTAAAPVGFITYPDEEFRIPETEMDRVMRVPQARLTRLFFGQLPYHVTDMQLQWLCHTFGHGAAIVFPERITKKDPMHNNAMVPTGCVHAYCHPDQTEALIHGMHKRILIDDTGVWHARTAAELAMMCAHTAVMKKDRTQRHRNRPYDTVVAQLATSTFGVRPRGNGATVRGELPTGSFAEHNMVCTRVLPPPPYKKVEATTTTAGETPVPTMDEEEVVLVPGAGNDPTVNVGGTQVLLSAPLADGATQFVKANSTAQGKYCTQHNTVGHDAAIVHPQGAVPHAPQTPPPAYQADLPPPPQDQNRSPPFAAQPSHGVTPPPFASHDEAEEGEEVVLVATQPGARGTVGGLG